MSADLDEARQEAALRSFPSAEACGEALNERRLGKGGLSHLSSIGLYRIADPGSFIYS
jgi:hypothetical protein